MMTALFSGALTATALFTGAVVADAPTEPIETGSAVVTVTSDTKTMPHFWASVSFGQLRCPDHAPFLESRNYSAGLPAGIAAIASGSGVNVASVTTYHPRHLSRATGIAYATATNWAVPTASRDVRLVAHCVAS